MSFPIFTQHDDDIHIQDEQQEEEEEEDSKTISNEWDSSNLEILINGGGQGGFGYSPNDALSLLSILEEQNCGNASNPIFRGYIWAGVCIELQTHDFPCIILRQFPNHWLNHLARSTPRRPKFHQHRLFTLHHQLIPARLCNLLHCNLREKQSRISKP